MSLILVLFLMVSFVFPLHHFAFWPYGEEGTHNRKSTADSLVVQLSTNKNAYKLGEPMIVTITLRNASRKDAFWVDKSRLIARSPSAFMLDVYDMDGKRLPGKIAVVDVSPSPVKEMDLVESILRTRTLFAPGDFLGLTRNLEDCGYTIREPGRYRLQASYSDLGLTDIADAGQIEAARTHEHSWILKIPLWSGEIKSQPVWIEITP